jgi:hypothetical protein
MDREFYALSATAIAITLVALATLWWTVMAGQSDPRRPISFEGPRGDLARQESR